MIASVSLLLLGVAVADAADGADESSKPAWSVHAGFPWTGVQYSPSSSEGFHWGAQAETALFRRWESPAGLRYSRAAGHHLSSRWGFRPDGFLSKGPSVARVLRQRPTSAFNEPGATSRAWSIAPPHSGPRLEARRTTKASRTVSVIHPTEKPQLGPALIHSKRPPPRASDAIWVGRRPVRTARPVTGPPKRSLRPPHFP